MSAMNQPIHARIIEPIPAHLVAALDAQGRLPPVDPKIAALNQPSRGRRDLTQEEHERLSWLALWSAGKMTGILAFRDVLDYPTNSDVREIVHVAGSARAVVELIHYAGRMARVGGRRMIGSIAGENEGMISLLNGMGYKLTRLTFEEVL